MLLTFLSLLSLLSVSNTSPVQRSVAAASTTVSTPLGVATGVPLSNGASRFVVQYAKQERWLPSVLPTTWTLPVGASDPTGLPDSCPQDPNMFSTNSTTEDCLSLVLYVPSTAKPGSNLPIIVWTHGGSFMAGSATQTGMDGSIFAQNSDVIVAFLQYRLGVFGFLAPYLNLPDTSTLSANLAMKDILNALKFVNLIADSFGGDPTKVTFAGQSSGASIVQDFLAIPSAAGYFNNVIAHSAPMDFGSPNVSYYEFMVGGLQSQLPCDSTNTTCLASLTTAEILAIQNYLYQSPVYGSDPSSGGDVPFRMINDGTFITSGLDTNGPLPTSTKPIMITFVELEGGPTIFGSFTSPVPADEFEAIVAISTTEEAASLIAANTIYLTSADETNANFDARPALAAWITDQVFRCAGYFFAGLWAEYAGINSTYVGIFDRGSVYPDSAGLGNACSETSVCHEGDIEILFGTVPNPTATQQTLITEVQARWKSFMLTSNPNPASPSNVISSTQSSTTKASGLRSGSTTSIGEVKVTLQEWASVSSGNVNAFSLGGASDGSGVPNYPLGACANGFYGSPNVPFLWQITGI